ncbi:MAG: serine/threonine-protein kinase [Egibacteraceae bacterium]
MTAPEGYDLEDALGDGGMGAVYRARQRSSGGRLVALKRVRVPGDQDLLARIRREAEILAALDHPHIVRVYEFVPDDGGIAIAMQYAPGGSLADRLAAQGRLEPVSVAAFAVPVAQALASAHRRDVLHRDVKPGNILFTSDGEPLLSDFGIARWKAGARLTQTGVQLGTAEYLDPEVADGSPPDERSDVYSLGVVCYEALTGGPPYIGPTPLAVLRATDLGAYTPLAQAAPDCPAALAQAVERAMARKREDRFPSATELVAALRRAALAMEPAQACGGPRPAAPSTGQPAEAAAPGEPTTAARPLVRRSGQPAPSAPAAQPSVTRIFGPRSAEATEATGSTPRVPKVLIGVLAVALLVLPIVIVLLLRGASTKVDPNSPEQRFPLGYGQVLRTGAMLGSCSAVATDVALTSAVWEAPGIAAAKMRSTVPVTVTVACGTPAAVLPTSMSTFEVATESDDRAPTVWAATFSAAAWSRESWPQV